MKTVQQIYLFLPFDLTSDFIPITGFIDDIIVVSLLLWLAVREINRVKKDLDKAKARSA